MSRKIMALAFCAVMTFTSTYADFDPCKFNFGTDWDYLAGNQESGVATNIDYVTKWIVDASFDGNPVYSKFCEYCKNKNKTPVFYGYIIAKAAALGDANVGGKLGTEGAGWLNSNVNNVVNYYKSFAQRVASSFGTEKAVIWLMEPDYYQYFDTGNQKVKLNYQQAGQWMGQMIDAVKQSLPNALFAVDVSPWIEWQSGRTASYYGAFPMDKIDFLFTSGGIALANSDKIKNEDPMTWGGLYSTVKKPIIADCGYGAGGGCTGHNAAWDDMNNLKTRIGNGVCAITQKCPNGSWGSTISSLNSSLANVEVKSCGGVISNKFTLTVTNSSGGTITRDPAAESYAAGTKVKLTATPSEGYVFKNWTGASSSTNAMVEITMDASKTISAVFEQKPANVAVLTIKIAGGMGSVTKSPDKAMYDKGSTVTLTAKPSGGISIFEGWSGGGLSGNELTKTITLNSDVTVTAQFKDTAKVDTIHIEAENFIEKSGDKIVAEASNGITSIGWIESGNSTTYKVNVNRAGTYALAFRVGSGLDNADFTVAIDGKSAGSISFPGTKDNWSTFQYETLSKTIDLTAGEHTIKLTYGGAINVDKFLLIMNMPAPIVTGKKAAVTGWQQAQLSASRGGFTAQLPSGHTWSSYSLFDFKGRMICKGRISDAMSLLSFSNLSQDVWILRLEGSNGCTSLRTAVMR
jgi:hypothetical protein